MSENTEASTEESPKTDEAPTKEQAKLVTFEDFMSVDLRVAQIVEAEKIEKSNKLVKLQISLGEELGKRQIVAGIAKRYSVEELIGRKIVVVANLAPAKLMGEESQGMLLAASTDDSLELVAVHPDMPPGAQVR